MTGLKVNRLLGASVAALVVAGAAVAASGSLRLTNTGSADATIDWFCVGDEGTVTVPANGTVTISVGDADKECEGSRIGVVVGEDDNVSVSK